MKAFGRIGRPALGPLISALASENEMIKRMAAQGLGLIKDSSAIEPLILAARQPNYVGVDAMESLCKITGQNLQTPAAWASWWDENKAKMQSPR